MMFTDPEALPPSDPPDVTLELEENPIVGVLLGPDGEVLIRVRERRTVAFGFAKFLPRHGATDPDTGGPND